MSSRADTRIAVLDDEPGFRQALSRLLRSHGFQIQLFATGAEFLTAALARPFDCLLLDLHMPGATGLDVLGALKTQGIQTPVIVITGHDQPGSAEAVCKLGALMYLLKPLDETTLLAAIGSATSPAA